MNATPTTAQPGQISQENRDAVISCVISARTLARESRVSRRRGDVAIARTLRSVATYHVGLARLYKIGLPA